MSEKASFPPAPGAPYLLKNSKFMEQTNGIRPGVDRGNARAEWLTSNRDAAKILDTYIDQAEQAFKARIQAAGKVLTGEVLQSFRADTAIVGAVLD